MNEEYRKTWGVKFRKPTADKELVDEHIYTCVSAMFLIFVSFVPVSGMAGPTAALLITIDDRNYNRFGIVEQTWKAGVIGVIIQTIVLFILYYF